MSGSELDELAAVLIEHLLKCLQMLLKLHHTLTPRECMETVNTSDFHDSSSSFVLLSEAPPHFKSISKLTSTELEPAIVESLGKPVNDPVEEDLGELN